VTGGQVPASRVGIGTDISPSLWAEQQGRGVAEGVGAAGNEAARQVDRLLLITAARKQSLLCWCAREQVLHYQAVGRQ
jgi:hypothetical protein